MSCQNLPFISSSSRSSADSCLWVVDAGWVTAKVFGLIAYILLGTVALKRGRTKGIRLGAFVAALLVYAWIASVALTKNVAGYLTVAA